MIIMAPSMAASPSRSKRGAYVTFLAGAGDYVNGVIALAKSLSRVGAAYPLVVAVLNDVPDSHRQILSMQGCIVRPIETIRPDGSEKCSFAAKHYVINYSKLGIWQFDDFEKLVYLDADTLVYDNIDKLLDLPHGRLYAVMDCFCEHTWGHSLQYKLKYCQQRPDRNPWPSSLGPPPPKYFNAGMIVLEPSKNTYKQLMVALRSSTLTPFAEQDFLNKFFGKVYTPLPSIYNLVMPMLWWHPEKINLEKVKVAHYCAPDFKPWRYTGKEQHMDIQEMKILVQTWWNVFEDEELERPPSGLALKLIQLGDSNKSAATSGGNAPTAIEIACAEARENPAAARIGTVPPAA